MFFGLPARPVHHRPERDALWWYRRSSPCQPSAGLDRERCPVRPRSSPGRPVGNTRDWSADAICEVITWDPWPCREALNANHRTPAGFRDGVGDQGDARMRTGLSRTADHVAGTAMTPSHADTAINAHTTPAGIIRAARCASDAARLRKRQGRALANLSGAGLDNAPWRRKGDVLDCRTTNSAIRPRIGWSCDNSAGYRSANERADIAPRKPDALRARGEALTEFGWLARSSMG